jgi:hypothetical protein
MTPRRVDGRTRWHDRAPWIALGLVSLLMLVTWATEAAWR